jgi:hypothetical protein
MVSCGSGGRTVNFRNLFVRNIYAEWHVICRSLSDITAAVPQKAARQGGAIMKSLGTIKIDPIRTAVSSEPPSFTVHHSPFTTNPSAPRLVIVDAISSATKSVIAKTRSEITGLDALLNAIAGTALNAK